MCETPWLPIQWVHYCKHLPIGGNTTWDEVIAGTALGKRVAKYKSGMRPAQIRAIEMQIEQQVGPDRIPSWRRITKTELGVVWYYYVVEDEIIGASLGQETNLVKVERELPQHWWARVMG
jgi:hypothetical protein